MGNDYHVIDLIFDSPIFKFNELIMGYAAAGTGAGARGGPNARRTF